MTEMNDLFHSGVFAVLLTLLAYQVGLVCQKKFRSPVFNPILIAVMVVLGVMVLTGLDLDTYRKGTASITWLITPATICLAVPMYEQTEILKKNIRAIIAGIAAGVISCLAFVMLFSAVVGFDRMLTISLMPKSVTSAIGVPLVELYGGAGSITSPAIIITGIIASVLSAPLSKILNIRDSVSMGVAMGTSGHVIATAKAGEIDPLTGAVSSLSLVIAGLLTSIVFPLAVSLL